MTESPSSRQDRVLRWALGPIPTTRVAAFRWISALSLLVYTLTWSLDAREWLTPLGYHISPLASRGLQLPVPLLGELGLWAFLIAYVGALAGIILDWRPRACSVVVFGGLLYVTTADRLASFSMNKLALVAWLILLLAPWPRTEPEAPEQADASTDAPANELRSAWPLRILQGTLLLQYFGAGICKIRGGWFAESDILWLQVQEIYMTEFAAWMIRELPLWIWALFQHSALGFELLAPLLFCVKRLRPLAFVWGLTMHLIIGLTMYRVGLFSFSVVAYYTLFMDETWYNKLGEVMGFGPKP